MVDEENGHLDDLLKQIEKHERERAALLEELGEVDTRGNDDRAHLPYIEIFWFPLHILFLLYFLSFVKFQKPQEYHKEVIIKAQNLWWKASRISIRGSPITTGVYSWNGEGYNNLK